MTARPTYCGDHGYVHDYESGQPIYSATTTTRLLSLFEARLDGGSGCITFRGRRVYVPERADDVRFLRSREARATARRLGRLDELESAIGREEREAS